MNNVWTRSSLLFDAGIPNLAHGLINIRQRAVFIHGRCMTLAFGLYVGVEGILCEFYSVLSCSFSSIYCRSPSPATLIILKVMFDMFDVRYCFPRIRKNEFRPWIATGQSNDLAIFRDAAV